MDIQILKKLVEEGNSSHAIAKKTGKAQTTIRYWLKKYNIKLQRQAVICINNKKICTKCQKEKELEEFYKKEKGLYHTYCKICLNEETILRQQKLKIQAVEYKGGKCEKCGYNNYIGALQFHHINPKEKDFNISRTNKSFDNIKTELDKCMLLCANCHAEEHNIK